MVIRQCTPHSNSVLQGYLCMGGMCIYSCSVNKVLSSALWLPGLTCVMEHDVSLLTVKTERIFYWLALNDRALWEQKASPLYCCWFSQKTVMECPKWVILKLNICKWILCSFKGDRGNSMEASLGNVMALLCNTKTVFESRCGYF